MSTKAAIVYDLNVSAQEVSKMATTTVPSMPTVLAEALGYMQRPIVCPEDVKARIMSLRVPADEVTGTRMTTNWRSHGSGGGSGGMASGGGGRSWTSGGGGSHRDTGVRYGGGGSGPNPHFRDGRGGGGAGARAAGGAGHEVRGGVSASGPIGGRSQIPYGRRPIQDAPRFGNKARKDVTTEERMMDRIRDKMNKFSEMTYDATKSWLSQLLDSGQTDFLTDFITLVFEKAAAEPTFCALYAKLITELRAGFPHINEDLRNIFNAFMNIFEEAAEEPEAGSAGYDEFVALRERRRGRRGYASFLGEITKLGVLTVDDIVRTCNVVLDGLAAARATEGKGQLCEEYAECLTTLMKGCESLLRPVVAPLLERVRALMVRGADAPSLTNKARFCLMDITDMF
jgi:hypothetical protein